MEINTTEKTHLQIREEIEALRCEMIGQYIYLGMFDKSYFDLFTKEQLSERMAQIATESKKIKDQYDQKYTEMLNAKS